MTNVTPFLANEVNMTPMKSGSGYLGQTNINQSAINSPSSKVKTIGLIAGLVFLGGFLKGRIGNAKKVIEKVAKESGAKATTEVAEATVKTAAKSAETPATTAIVKTTSNKADDVAKKIKKDGFLSKTRQWFGGLFSKNKTKASKVTAKTAETPTTTAIVRTTAEQANSTAKVKKDGWFAKTRKWAGGIFRKNKVKNETITAEVTEILPPQRSNVSVVRQDKFRNINPDDIIDADFTVLSRNLELPGGSKLALTNSTPTSIIRLGTDKPSSVIHLDPSTPTRIQQIKALPGRSKPPLLLTSPKTTEKAPLKISTEQARAYLGTSSSNATGEILPAKKSILGITETKKPTFPKIPPKDIKPMPKYRRTKPFPQGRKYNIQR